LSKTSFGIKVACMTSRSRLVRILLAVAPLAVSACMFVAYQEFLPTPLRVEPIWAVSALADGKVLALSGSSGTDFFLTVYKNGRALRRSVLPHHYLSMDATQEGASFWMVRDEDQLEKWKLTGNVPERVARVSWPNKPSRLVIGDIAAGTDENELYLIIHWGEPQQRGVARLELERDGELFVVRSFEVEKSWPNNTHELWGPQQLDVDLATGKIYLLEDFHGELYLLSYQEGLNRSDAVPKRLELNTGVHADLEALKGVVSTSQTRLQSLTGASSTRVTLFADVDTGLVQRDIREFEHHWHFAMGAHATTADCGYLWIVSSLSHDPETNLVNRLGRLEVCAQ
jgi:hypothetical protein